MRKFRIFTLSFKNDTTRRFFSFFTLVDANKWSNFEKRCRMMNAHFHDKFVNFAKMSSCAKIMKNEIPRAKKDKWISNLVRSVVSLFVTERATKLHEYVDRRHIELGPIFRDRIGPIELIFVNSPANFLKIFRHEGPTPMHFLPESWHCYNRLRNCSRGLLFMDGEEWLYFRRIMNKVMLLPNPKYTMVPRCYEAANDLVDEWKTYADTSKTVKDLEMSLYRWSIKVMLATLVGSSWKIYKRRMDDETSKLARILHRIFALSAKLSLIPVKYAVKFHLPVWREFCVITDEALGLVRSIVCEILRFRSDDGLLSRMIDEGITNEKDLVRIVTDLIIAAGDTTAYSTQWALFFLAKNSQVQEKFYERIVNLNKMELMDDNYARAIIKESLRLYPTAPFLTRFLPDDATIAGHTVHKGELIIMSMYSSGRDPKNFPEPNDFRPERWMRNEAGNYEQVTNPHGSLPFALGARSCVGRKLAETQILLTLSQIIKNFKIDCPNADAIKMKLHLIAIPSKPIQLKLSKR